MAPTTRTTKSVPKVSILDELTKLSDELKDVPYPDLAAAAAERGWHWRLVETSCLSLESGPLINTTRGTMPYPEPAFLVSFDLYVGKETLELVDTITVQVPRGISHISSIARMAAQASTIYMVLGRNPPLPIAPPAPADAPRGAFAGAQPIVGQDDVDQQIEMPDEDIDLGRPKIDPWQPNGTAEKQPTLEVVAERTPDGVPLFIDPYGAAERGPVLIEALLGAIREALPRIETEDQLNALYTKNNDAMAFIKEIGNDRERGELQNLFGERQAQLRAMTPRRRAQPAAATH